MEVKTGRKKVLITSNGDEISEGIIYHLAKCGCRLVLMGDKIALEVMARRITESLERIDPSNSILSNSIQAIELNMEGEETVFDQSVDQACKLLGGIDAFVNCHVYEGKIQELVNVGEYELKKTTQIDLLAPLYLLKAISKRMRDLKSGGSIVFVSSIAGAERGIYSGSAAYSSCMGAIQQLIRASAIEIGKYNIRVNAIARGLHLDDPYPVFIGRERSEKLTDTVMPLNRWLNKKNDLASTVMYCVNDGSRYMTGTTIFVDGAQSIVRPRMRSYM